MYEWECRIHGGFWDQAIRQCGNQRVMVQEDRVACDRNSLIEKIQVFVPPKLYAMQRVRHRSV